MQTLCNVFVLRCRMYTEVVMVRQKELAKCDRWWGEDVRHSKGQAR